MSADAVTDPIALTQTESNTARKKRAKADQAAAAKTSESSALPETPAEETVPSTNGDSNGQESAYVKELQKYGCIARIRYLVEDELR